MSEKCQRCGKRYDTVYTLPDYIWRKISPKGSLSGMLCPECADEIAREKGIVLYWTANENDYRDCIKIADEPDYEEQYMEKIPMTEEEIKEKIKKAIDNGKKIIKEE
jgi:hypothetical protein